MKGVVRTFAVYRPLEPLKFADGRCLVYKNEKALKTVRTFSCLVFGGTAWMLNSVLLHSAGMGWFSYIFHLGATFAGLGLSRRIYITSKIFISTMSLLPTGKSVEITNTELLPGTITIPITDICLNPDDPTVLEKGKYMKLSIKSGQFFMLSAEGHASEKEVLKSILKGEEIDLSPKETTDIIDV